MPVTRLSANCSADTLRSMTMRTLLGPDWFNTDAAEASRRGTYKPTA
jgi:hypothetical protein